MTGERRDGDTAVLAAIEALRADVSTRLGAQDMALEEMKGQMVDMKKVLPMKFFTALDGTAKMGGLIGAASVTVTKIGAACIVGWAFFKFVVLEAIRQTPK